MSLFSDLKPVKHNSRNVFDISQTDSFSSKLGILTPCFCLHTVPHAKYKINCSDIVRVSEQQTANFVGMNQNIEFAFVPYSQLWHDFNRSFYGRGEEMRNIGQEGVSQPAITPIFQTYFVFWNLIYTSIYYTWYEAQKERIYENGDLLPDEVIEIAEDTGLVLRDGVDWFDSDYIDVHGRFAGFDQMRVLDMLGYGNILPIYKFAHPGFHNLEDEVEGETYTSIPLAKSATAASDSDFLAAVESAIQNALNTVEPMLPEAMRNPFSLMAYVKFFSDVYRNRQYDDKPYFKLFNCDFWAGVSDSNPTFTASEVLRMCKPFYRQYKKDLFTGLYPNQQFGNVSVAQFDHQTNLRLSGNTSTSVTDLKVANVSGGSVVYQNVSPYRATFDVRSEVSALAVRQAEALQRFKESIVRAGNREKDLQKALFGVGSKYIEDCYVDFLGSFSTPIQMNPVAATGTSVVNNNETNLGDLGAYSVGSLQMGSQKEIEYDSYDFGVIIGFVYILPETKYEAYGVNPHNIKFRSEDYYNPFFQNLGLAPVYSYFNNQFGLAGAAPSTSVLGYLSRYYEYKTNINRVHGEFFGSNPCVPYDELDISAMGYDDPSVLYKATQGVFSHYVAPRDVRETNLGTLQMLYVDPKDADNIFHMSDRAEQAYDHFKFELTTRVKGVLPMSVLGLPV